MFGWISASHQMGAAAAAFIAGASRSVSGSYLESFVAAGFIGIAAAFVTLMIGRSQKPATPAPA
jgi:VIT1/CCC1 family predicted Fe2+/Mn2+ transporter